MVFLAIDYVSRTQNCNPNHRYPMNKVKRKKCSTTARKVPSHIIFKFGVGKNGPENMNIKGNNIAIENVAVLF